MEEERISQLGKSETVIEQNIKSLKQLFPQVFTEDKINFSLLEDLLGEKIEDKKEYYELSWAGKSDARKELSKSTVATLTPDREKSVDFDNTQNLFIEGENLEVLRTLQKSYFGKIKMIYIDPPYNTGSDSFVYPDNYSETKKEYEKRIGKVDEEGYINKVELWKQNTKENGQYHSVWLSMMYSRLSYAHSLLSEDGVIFISIDENEQANLKLLCDSIFGENNFVGCAGRITKKSNNKGDYWSPNFDYILTYVKDISCSDVFLGGIDEDTYDHVETEGERKGEKYKLVRLYMSTIQNRNPEQRFWIDCPDGTKIIPPGTTFPPERPNLGDGIWRWTKKKFELERNKIVVKEVRSSNLIDENKLPAKWNVYTKTYLKDVIDNSSAKPNSFIEEHINQKGSHELTELNIPFSYSKPSSLIKYLASICKTSNNDIILDFFAGSCTTGHAVMELNKEDGGNRKYICIQMPEKTDKKSEAYKQGYEKISDIGAERLRRAGKRIKEEIEKDRKENDEKLLDKKEIQDIDTGFKYYRLTPSHFKVWQNDINENELGKQLDAFIDATKEGSVEEEMLYELILKSGFSLTTPIEKNGKGFYYIKEWQTCIALENFNKEIIETIFELKPKEVITLDKFFENNDSLLSNTRLEFKDKEIILTII